MGDIHDNLREVMGLLGKATPDWRAYPYGAIRSGQFHEYVNGSAQLQNAMFTGEFRDEDRDAALAAVNFLRQHGPALLARQEGEGSLRFIAKRNLRRMIEIGSTDTKTMLLCLEELS